MMIRLVQWTLSIGRVGAELESTGRPLCGYLLEAISACCSDLREYRTNAGILACSDLPTMRVGRGKSALTPQGDGGGSQGMRDRSPSRRSGDGGGSSVNAGACRRALRRRLDLSGASTGRCRTRDGRGGWLAGGLSRAGGGSGGGMAGEVRRSSRWQGGGRVEVRQG